MDLDDNPITKFADAAVGLFTGEESIEQSREDIKKAVARIGKQIFVFIDELDRLESRESLEVVRLIRNTANFPNTIFVVSYDRNYLIRAIKEQNDYNNEFFLEKIFQLEIPLPYHERLDLEDKLLELLKQGIPAPYHPEVEAFIRDSPRTTLEGRPSFEPFIGTIRDCTRFTNSFTLHFNQLQGEVVLADLFLLELIRFKFPEVYALLYKQHTHFLETDQHSHGEYSYVLKRANDSPGRPSHEYQIEGYLRDHASRLSLPIHQIDVIMVILKSLFGKKQSWYKYSEKNHLSVIFPSNYYRYFSFRLLQGDLSEVEFSNYRHKNQEEFNDKISQWVEKGLSWQLAKRFKKISQYDSREDFEKIIKGIWFKAHLPTEPGRYYNYYEKGNLYQKLKDYDKQLSKAYYSGDQELLRRFILDLFRRAEVPYYFESELVASFLDEYPENFTLTKGELEEIVVRYFENYLNAVNQLDDTVWHLYRRCTTVEWKPAGPHSHTKQKHKIQRANELFIEFISSKDLDGFLYEMVSVNHRNDEMVSFGTEYIWDVSWF